jgi:hypothetical protein
MSTRATLYRTALDENATLRATLVRVTGVGGEMDTLRAQLAEAQVDILSLTTADNEWVSKMETAERNLTTIEQIAQGLADALRSLLRRDDFGNVATSRERLAAFDAYQTRRAP